MESSINTGIISFVGADQGTWKVMSMQAITGQTMQAALSVDVVQGAPSEHANWVLKAFISNLRYTSKSEKTHLNLHSKSLGDPKYNYAALIPIKKSDEWWALAQDERRAIFEEDSHHISVGAQYLSVVSRQLYHCKDLGEPFDFLTWFEFSSEHVGHFDALCDALRNTLEWKYVTREVDIRLEKQQ